MVKDYKLPDEFEKVNREFFLFSEKQGKAYEKITCNINYKPIRDKMIDTVISSSWKKSEKFNSLDAKHQSIIINFITTSSLEIYKHWIRNGKQVPLEEIIEISNTMITSAIKAFFKNINVKEKKK